MATKGFTSWPRLDPRPEPMAWSEWAFEVALTFTRPIFQVIGMMNIAWPLWRGMVEGCTSRGLSERFIFAAVTVGTHHFVWFYMNCFFIWVEQFGWLGRFRLPTNPASEPALDLKKEAIFKSFVGGIPMFAGAFIFFPVYKYFGMAGPLDPLPSTFELWKFFALVKLGSMVTFDLTHRVIHGARFYKFIHHQHHRFISTKSYAAEFAHPLEGAGPILVPLILGMHPYAWCSWLFWEQTNSAIAHSGYCFRIFPGKLARVFGLGLLAEESAYHHYHHYSIVRGNFSNPILDHLFGTHDDWLHMGGIDGYIATLEKAQQQREKSKAA